MKRRTLSVKVDFDLDFKFIALIPALNINLHSCSLEFEWLVLGVYINFSIPSQVMYSKEFTNLVDSVENKISKL